MNRKIQAYRIYGQEDRGKKRKIKSEREEGVRKRDIRSEQDRKKIRRVFGGHEGTEER